MKKNIFIKFFKKQIKIRKKGLSLLEVMVSIFIFTLAMTMVSGIFVSFFNAFRFARAEQRAFEDASYSLNLMTKIIRTSKIESSTPSSIKLWDYSQPACYYFSFAGGSLSGDQLVAADDAACFGVATTASSVFAVTGVTGSFDIDTTSSSATKVTILINSDKDGGTNGTTMQTSVLLRNK
jgi:prepilin-type N-terminal cleavage/methylation domain-containing protein